MTDDGKEGREEREEAGRAGLPAERVIETRAGYCRFCHQMRFVDIPEGAAPQDVDEMATEECDCKGARIMRERMRRMQDAGKWAQGIPEEGLVQPVLCAIKAVFEGEADSVTVRAGRRTYGIDMDAKGMLRIRTAFRDDDIVKF